MRDTFLRTDQRAQPESGREGGQASPKPKSTASKSRLGANLLANPPNPHWAAPLLPAGNRLSALCGQAVRCESFSKCYGEAYQMPSLVLAGAEGGKGPSEQHLPGPQDNSPR